MIHRLRMENFKLFPKKFRGSRVFLPHYAELDLCQDQEFLQEQFDRCS